MFKNVTSFKMNMHTTVKAIMDLNINNLNHDSLTFLFHFAAIVLIDCSPTTFQANLIILLLEKAINIRSIASIHFIQNIIVELLSSMKNGISTTCLWLYIKESNKFINFQSFLANILKCMMQIMVIPNEVLIDTCLSFFKTTFSALCKYRDKSFSLYFKLIEQLFLGGIKQTITLRTEFMRLRKKLFSIISVVWLNENQLELISQILTNIRDRTHLSPDLLSFMRYLTDVTGLLKPVQNANVFRFMVELILKEIHRMLLYFFPNE